MFSLFPIVALVLFLITIAWWMRREKLRPRKNAETVHIVGGGIAGMTTAVYLVVHNAARNILIYEDRHVEGGSIDGAGDSGGGYIIRGGRMFDMEGYLAMFDLLSHVPSSRLPGKTARDDFMEFNKTFATKANARLGLFDLAKLSILPEWQLGRRTIADCFGHRREFFETNFWRFWSTTFAFQPFHSAVEMRRYMKRSLHELPKLHDLGGVRRTFYNQYDSIIFPIRRWLESRGVRFILNAQVIDAKFSTSHYGARRVEEITVLRSGAVPQVIPIGPEDSAVFTIGSMTADATLGSSGRPAAPMSHIPQGHSFRLWQRMAQQLPAEVIGCPDNFIGRVKEAAFTSFTMTFHDPLFLDRMTEWTGSRPGTGALCTVVDSPWYMSTVIPYQPHFANQPADVSVAWGYGLKLDTPGKFVPKPMPDCSGHEMLTEIMGHFGFTGDEQRRILATTTCIPCNMPFITSQFLTRTHSDRPVPVHQTSENFGFVGQFVEIPDDCAFLVDSSVRSGMIVVKKLFGIRELAIPSIWFPRDPATLFHCARALFAC